MEREYWAHVQNVDGALQHHRLDAHLRKVAALAATSAALFGAATWAELAGRWHDLGKYRAGFQRKLRVAGGIDAHIEGAGDRVTHSTAGAIHAVRALGEAHGSVLAFLIAGHHAGLPDRHTNDGAGGALSERLQGDGGALEHCEALAEDVPPDILEAPASAPAITADAEGFALWVRMLFSCLVDADFLDTERFFNPQLVEVRGKYPALATIKACFDDAMAMKVAASASHVMSPVNTLRADVLAQCRTKGADAALPPGFFSLTVPTGGGKTLSSLAFALEHACTHQRRRIVYAIPFTSIIEQTAAVFRETFAGLGTDIVIEHHSSLDVREDRENHASRLASENWDAPLIVTTNVQLFESLHAARTSRCRKLHNLVGSVIVLDEAQQLPREFLASVLRVLRQLVAHYGVSVVLCTATQPALTPRRDSFGRLLLDGIPAEAIRPIIDDPQPLFDAMRRVDVHLPADFNAPTPWADIAARIANEDCVLAIVNVRKHARDLARLLPDAGTEHLSALLCAEHRSDVIARIRCRLRDRATGSDTAPLRVVSTQLVEAGVDLDFPVVFRALAGLDSIAQAAGRCNREGRLATRGQVHVFVPERAPPPGLLRQGAQTTREMAQSGALADPLAPATFLQYFDRFYAHEGRGFDREGILPLLAPAQAAFRTAAARFRLIDDEGESIIVPYRRPSEVESPVEQWLNVLNTDAGATWARRKLQRYTVSMPKRCFERLLRQGDIEERAGLWVALPSRYDAIYGLMLPEDHGSSEDFFV